MPPGVMNVNGHYKPFLKIGHFLCFNDIPVGRGHIDSVTDR